MLNMLMYQSKLVFKLQCSYLVNKKQHAACVVKQIHFCLYYHYYNEFMRYMMLLLQSIANLFKNTVKCLVAPLTFNVHNKCSFRGKRSLVHTLPLFRSKSLYVLFSCCFGHTNTQHTHTHTHTHTHVGFCGLWGLSIGVMVFILNKLYVLLPYTYPTPKLSPHRRLCAFLDFQKNTI